MNGGTTASVLPTGTVAPERAQPSAQAETDARSWVQALYRRRSDFVWRTLRGLGVPEAHVDDAVQEVFIVVYRRRHDYLEDRSEKSWIFQIARHVASNERRTRRRKANTLPLEEEAMPSAGASADQQVELKQAAAILMRFLDTLDEDQRSVFVSMELSGLSAPEVAEALNVKLNTVYSRLRLARVRWERFAHDRAESEGGLHNG